MALVRDFFFTFSSKVIKSFIMKEHLNVKKKEKKGEKRQKSGADGIRSWDVWIKKIC
jgi:hypothetical protein